MFVDFLLNLVSEGLGIIVTVFLVDRLLDRREAQRWQPSKSFVRARLFGIVDEFMNELLGGGFNFEERGEQHLYYFGRASIMSEGSLKSTDVSSLCEGVERRLEFKRDLGKEFDFSSIERTQQKLAVLFDSSGALIEPEVSAMMLELEDELTSVLKMKGSSNLNKNLPILLCAAAIKAKTLRVYLEGKADKVQLLTEHLKEVREDVMQIRKANSKRAT